MPFINVANGCATGGSALISAYNAINAGAADVVMALGFDKHPRGAFDPNPADWGLGQWYGDSGLMLTTQFFGLKIQRYMHEHGISSSTLAKVAAKAFRNGRSTRTPGGASRSRRRRCSAADAHRTRSRSTCSARPARAAWRWCSAGAIWPPASPPIRCSCAAAVLRSRPFG